MAITGRRTGPWPVFVDLFLSQPRGLVPPPASEGLKQRRGVGEPGRPRLHESKFRRLISLLSVEQSQIGDLSQFQLLADNRQTDAGGLFGRDRGSQPVRVGLQRM